MPTGPAQDRPPLVRVLSVRTVLSRVRPRQGHPARVQPSADERLCSAARAQTAGTCSEVRKLRPTHDAAGPGSGDPSRIRSPGEDGHRTERGSEKVEAASRGGNGMPPSNVRTRGRRNARIECSAANEHTHRIRPRPAKSGRSGGISVDGCQGAEMALPTTEPAEPRAPTFGGSPDAAHVGTFTGTIPGVPERRR